MRERSGRQDVPERKRPEGLARRASAANATNESGGEAEKAGGSGGTGWARATQLAEPERASHSGAAARSRGGSWRTGWHALQSRRTKIRSESPPLVGRRGLPQADGGVRNARAGCL